MISPASPNLLRLARRESACCPFFEFALRIEADVVMLRILVPLAEANNLALIILRSMEIEPKDAQDVLDRQSAAAGPPERAPAAVDAGDPGRKFSGPAAGALELAAMEAMSLGHNYIGCEHLLLGLIGETAGIAGQAPRAAGAELRLSRRAVTAAIAGCAHLRAEQTKEAATAAAIRHDMRHVTARLDRLEERLAALTGDEAGERPAGG